MTADDPAYRWAADVFGHMTADSPAYRWAADVFGHMTADDPGTTEPVTPWGDRLCL